VILTTPLGLRWLRGTQGHGQCHHSIERIDFVFDFNKNCVSIFCRFRDIAGYLSKVVDFDPPNLHFGAPVGVNPVEFRGDLWQPKSRLPGLSCCTVTVCFYIEPLYTVSQKKQDTKLLAITSPTTIGFSNFFSLADSVANLQQTHV